MNVSTTPADVLPFLHAQVQSERVNEAHALFAAAKAKSPKAKALAAIALDGVRARIARAEAEIKRLAG